MWSVLLHKFGSVVQWLGHATVNRSIKVQVLADPLGYEVEKFGHLAGIQIRDRGFKSHLRPITLLS